eukprot:16447983-Heterocapsa_arctica.AAC.1
MGPWRPAAAAGVNSTRVASPLPWPLSRGLLLLASSRGRAWGRPASRGLRILRFGNGAEPSPAQSPPFGRFHPPVSRRRQSWEHRGSV